MWFIILLCLINSSCSSFVLILHVPSLSFVTPKIFLNNFLFNTLEIRDTSKKSLRWSRKKQYPKTARIEETIPISVTQYGVRQADGQVWVCGSEERTMTQRISVTLRTQMGIVSSFLRRSFFPFDPFYLITTLFSLRLTFWYSC